MKQAWVLATTSPCVPTDTITKGANSHKDGMAVDWESSISRKLAQNCTAIPMSRILAGSLPLFSRQAVMRLKKTMVTILRPNSRV